MRLVSYRRKARIEIIPLIDIVFFLLATFVMVSLSMVKNQGVNVRLPAASTGARQSTDKGFVVVSVTADGEIYLNKKRVNEREFSTRLKELKQSQSDPTIFLNGDERTLLGRAVFILDEARKLGIKKFALGTRNLEG